MSEVLAGYLEPEEEVPAWAEVLDGEEEDWTGFRLFVRPNGRSYDTAVIWDGEFFTVLRNWRIWVSTCPDPQAVIEEGLSGFPEEIDWIPVGDVEHKRRVLIGDLGWTQEV